MTAFSSGWAQDARVSEAAREVARLHPSSLGRGLETQARDTAPDTAQALADSREYGELGILHDATPPKYFSLSLEAGAYYTSNAALLPDKEIDDWYFNQGLAAQWSRGFLDQTLFPRISLSQDWYEYARTDNRLKEAKELIPDFAVLEASAGLAWRPKALLGAVLSADYAYERLTDLDWSEENFSEHHLRIGLSRAFQVSSTHTFFLGALADFSLETDPAPAERHEYRAYTGYHIAWTPELSTTLSYYYGYYDYQSRSREDHNHTLSLGAQWAFCPHAALNLRLDLTRNDSSVSSFDYDNLTAGLSALVSFPW